MALLMLCIKIFFVRILDVSLGTIRTIVTVKGKTFLASLIGFVEVFVWFVIVKEALDTDVNSLWVAVSYALGFATGTYVGGFLSDKFIKGTLGVQIILSSEDDFIVEKIREEGYAVSVLNVKGKSQKDTKYMLIMEIKSDQFNHLKSLIKTLDERAFIVVNETKFVHNGYFAK